MVEILFYHLTQTPLEKTLPGLLEKSLQRGWRVVVQTGDPARLEFLDNILWSYRDDAFLPHAVEGGEDVELQPIYLTQSADTPNGADVLMLVDGATLDVERAAEFSRVCLLFDGNDATATEAARTDWKAVTTAELPAKYWAQDGGRWSQKAESG